MSGRARGRARGRPRGGTDEQQARQPREPEQAAAVPPPPVMPPREPQAPPPSHPGVASGEGPHVPTRELGALTIGTGAASEVGRRRREFRYVEARTRPAHIVDKRGTVGNQLPLITNFFRMERAPDWHMYQYHVDFNPVVDSKRMRIALLLQHENLLGRTRAFDGMVLFLPFRLQEQTTELYTKRNTDNVNIRITITLTNELPPNSPQCLQVYNIIFRRVLAMVDMKQIGRNYYNPSLAIDIRQHKLQVLPGFVTSILQYENEVLLNCDISHKIIQSDSVLDLMYDMYHRNPNTFHDDATRLLVGSVVLTRYNNRTYRVDDIAWDKRPGDTFKLHDGSDISYSDYYKKNYEIDVGDDDQPLLVSKPKKKDIRRGQKDNIYLVPELCKMTGLSDEARADFNVMKDVGAHTRVAPAGRTQTLTAFLRQINSNQNVRNEMEGWGLRFSQDLLNLNGRILPQEKVFQQGGELSYKQEEAEWSRDMRGKQLITAVGLENWVIIFTRKNSGQAQEFVQTLSRVGPPMGMKIAQPIPCELSDDRNDSYLTALRNSITPQTQLVMCVLQTNKKDRYDAIKKFTCVDRPVPSQVIVSRTLSKKQMMMSVATKVAIQLNCKLGGEVWALEIPLRSLMVIGMDVYHDSAKKGRSVAGIVASMNTRLTTYYSRVRFQHQYQELVDGLAIPLIGALQKYHEVNGNLPERIIVFRDGVGDDQLPAVSEHEVPQMLKSFKTAGGQDYNPKVGVVVVKKRINSRFFARAGPQLTNPPPGTVIDVEVTKPEWYDFFLVSQSVRQGTVSPTHYNVIWDTTGLRPDHMQRLTYKLCHLYYNWPGTIRVPAPCQYAHKLAFLVGQSIHREPSLDLADRLYFL